MHFNHFRNIVEWMEQSVEVQTFDMGLLPLADDSRLEIGQMTTTNQGLYHADMALVFFFLAAVVLLLVWQVQVHFRWRKQMKAIESSCQEIREKRAQVLQDLQDVGSE